MYTHNTYIHTYIHTYLHTHTHTHTDTSTFKETNRNEKKKTQDRAIYLNNSIQSKSIQFISCFLTCQLNSAVAINRIRGLARQFHVLNTLVFALILILLFCY